MTVRSAACSCGQLRLTAREDPIRATVCHCLACQRRTGSVFGAQARVSIYDDRMHPWVGLLEPMEHLS